MKIPEIGIEMKKFRKENGYTQAYLARKLNVSVQAISNYETGKSMPNMAVIIRFASLADISIPELIFFEKIKYEYAKKNKFSKEPVEEIVLKCFERLSYKKFLKLSDTERSYIIEDQLDKVRQSAKNSPFYK